MLSSTDLLQSLSPSPSAKENLAPIYPKFDSIGLTSVLPVSRAEVTGRLSLPDATSAHAREMVGNLGPQ